MVAALCMDNAGMDHDIEELIRRHDELERLLQDPDTTRDRAKLKAVSKEYAEAGQAIETHEALQEVESSIRDVHATLKDADEELAALAREELATLEKKRADLTKNFQEYFRPHDPMEGKNIIMEIRAGVGGDEAALFAAELTRMYLQYAEQRGWRTTVASANRTTIGGYKEAILEVRGSDAYRQLKFESGVHRVQRVPSTEKSGRVHTSTATVVVMPEPEEKDIEIRPEDVSIEATTSSGHGGQSVNTTYSAIRMIHLPTGITVSCQDERSQKQNKERAMTILRARVFALMEEDRRKKETAERRSQIGTGDRSEKIRTYNIPQDRLTDHRIKQSFPAVQSILNGGLDPVITALHAYDRS